MVQFVGIIVTACAPIVYKKSDYQVLKFVSIFNTYKHPPVRSPLKSEKN